MRTWFNGQLLKTPDAPVISPLDHGVVVGDGVFETVQISGNQPFALTRHLDRLVRSAEGLGIGTPDVGAIREGIAATMDGEDIDFGRIRVTVTSGPGPLGSPRGDAGLTYVVISEPCSRPPAVSSIATVPWPRNERGAVSGLKTTSYAENALMVEHALARGASEAVMANTQGQLCEGTGSNIFYVVGERLITPTLAAGPLAGVTRALVLQWCADEIDVVEQDAPIEVLQTADEVILVGTTRNVQAISKVDDRELPAPGPITQRAQAIWAREAARGIDP
ncbi:aminotransferase class IV [Aeromicrobium chenweiae]|uniref:4-amino-4-deoxychorismate lyase n=1 Tax=Aeromicrobium chenweiae TaxID=2079793 RepID=A0A2S0WMR0_9ACTN|nr:aminotransferase class IV [Aeromicrobium chenweiae]AWB92601.1 4-amino-4-deoxychorismate lyase [Aeromicrobium chenweiae]TGN33589.1 4-amino-4-deoxychorismate lyase [Aeromicrobium chenweiae]